MQPRAHAGRIRRRLLRTLLGTAVAIGILAVPTFAQAASPTITSGPGAFTNKSSVRFTFTPGTASCRIDSGVWRKCVSPKNYVRVGEGRHTFQVNAYRKTTTYHFWVDTIAPTPTLNYDNEAPIQNDGELTANLALGFDKGTGLEQGAKAFQRRIATAVNGKCPSNWTANNPAGFQYLTIQPSTTHTYTTGQCVQYRMVTKDRAGNFGIALGKTVLFDLDKPTGTIGSVSRVESGNFEVRGTANDATTSPSAVLVMLTDTENGAVGNANALGDQGTFSVGGTTTIGANGAWSVNFDATKVDAGETYDVTAIITDQAGNVTSVQATGASAFTAPTAGGITLADNAAAVTEGATPGARGAGDTFTVELNQEPNDSVTVTLAVTGGASSDVELDKTTLYFTPANWNTAQTVTAYALGNRLSGDDRVVDVVATATAGDPSFVGSKATATVTVTDNTAANTIVTTNPASPLAEGDTVGTSTTFTVALSVQPAAGKTVTLSVVPTGDITATPATLSFNSTNYNTAQTVTITTKPDMVDSGSATRPASVAVTVSASDDPQFAVGMGDVVTTVITDNESGTADVLVSPSFGSTAVTEGGASDTFDVKLATQPTANVTIKLAPGNNPERITLDKTILTFTPANWNVAQTVTVSAVNDNVVNGNVTSTVVFTITSDDAVYNAETEGPLNVSVTDNDTSVAGLTVTPTTATVAEQASTTATVALKSQPSAAVTVTFTKTGTGDVTFSPTALVFTPANWNTPQTVTITGVNDGTVTVDANIYSQDAAYDANQTADTSTTFATLGATPITVTVTRAAAGLLVTPTTGTVYEAGTTSTTYGFRLASRPDANVTVTFSNDDMNAAEVGGAAADVTSTPGTLVFTDANWDQVQYLTITAIDDPVVEPNETIMTSYNLTSTDNNYNGKFPGSVTTTVISNE